MTFCLCVEALLTAELRTKNPWEIPLYQQSRYKSRGITKPRDWFGRDMTNLKFHLFAWDGTRISRDLPRFHGTGLHGDRDFEKKKHGTGRDGIGIANISTGPLWTGTGFSKFHETTGLSRILCKSCEVFTTGKNAEEKKPCKNFHR